MKFVSYASTSGGQRTAFVGFERFGDGRFAAAGEIVGSLHEQSMESVGDRRTIDRQRVAAVRKLEGMGYTFVAGDWMEPANDMAAPVEVADRI